MSAALSTLSRICIVVLILGGAVVTVLQIVGIAIGDGALVVFAGEELIGPITIVAGLAGIFSFLRLYTERGKAEAETRNIDTDEAV